MDWFWFNLVHKLLDFLADPEMHSCISILAGWLSWGGILLVLCKCVPLKNKRMLYFANAWFWLGMLLPVILAILVHVGLNAFTVWFNTPLDPPLDLVR